MIKLLLTSLESMGNHSPYLYTEHQSAMWIPLWPQFNLVPSLRTNRRQGKTQVRQCQACLSFRNMPRRRSAQVSAKKWEVGHDPHPLVPRNEWRDLFPLGWPEEWGPVIPLNSYVTTSNALEHLTVRTFIKSHRVYILFALPPSHLRSKNPY